MKLCVNRLIGWVLNPYRGAYTAAQCFPCPEPENPRMNKALILLLAVVPLAACVAPQRIEPVPAAVPEPVYPAVSAVSPVAGISGLETREPDVCKASTYRSAIGQPGAVIPTLGVSREYRVVEYRGIEDQEYDPMRVIFRLDQSGNISNIDCG